MKKAAIVTDTTACVPQEQITRLCELEPLAWKGVSETIENGLKVDRSEKNLLPHRRIQNH